MSSTTATRPLTILLKALITTLNHRCNIWLLVDQTSSHPSTVSKAVDIVTQHIMEDRVGELDIAVMVEDMVVLKDRRKLTFREADDSEGMEEDTIMEQGVVGMAEVAIQVAVRVTPRGRCLSDDMVGSAAVVDEIRAGHNRALCLRTDGLIRVKCCRLNRRDYLRSLVYSIFRSRPRVSVRKRSLVQFINLCYDGGVHDEPRWMLALSHCTA